MKTTAYISHSDCSRHDTGWRHPEHQGRLPAVARAVYRDMLTLFEPLLEVEARAVGEEELRMAHSAAYVQRVRAAAEEAESAGRVLRLEGETMISGASWDAARAATGAALTAVELVLDGVVRNAFCAVRPPGQGAGEEGPGRFALFNHVAVAARYLGRRRVEPVLVLEVGAVAGSGTLQILGRDPGVRIVSVAQPGGAEVGEGRRIMVPLPAGSDGDVAIAAVEEGLERALAGFSPRFILLSTGFDALESDPLGGLALRPRDYHPLTVAVRQSADQHCEGRLVSVLEGGYDPRGTGEAVVQHLRALAGLPPA